MMQNPLDLSQADLSGLMEVGHTVADASAIGGGNNPLSGVGELLNTIERVINVWGQVNNKVNESGMTIAKLRGMIDPQDQSGFVPSGQIIDATVYRPVDSPPITVPSPDEPTPDPEPAPAPTVEPIKLYSTMLSYLSKLADPDSPFRDLTLKDALELARANKTLVLGAIEEELPKILGLDGRSDA
jgi:hypothetical protein